MAQFPSNIVNTQQNASISPLARMLSEHLQRTRGRGLGFDEVSPVMHGVLAMAAAVPFDPKEKVDFESGYHQIIHEKLSLSEAVLRLACANQEPPTQQWPRTIDGFGPGLEKKNYRDQPMPIGTEWVAAAFTAAGCNPWEETDLSGNALPGTMRKAIELGMGGLVDQLLDCQGAPKAQQILDQIVGDTELFNAVISSPRNSSVIQALLARDARLTTEEQALNTLSVGDHEVVVLLGQAGLPKIEDATRKKILAAWTARAKQDLRSSAVEEMIQHTFGQTDPSMSGVALDIQRLLSVEWGKPPRGSAAQAYDFTIGNGDPQDNAMSRATVKAGAMGGTWSLFAAAVGSRMRMATDRGALGWSTPLMLFRKFDQEEQKWKVADCSKPPFRGSLAKGLGFEWKDGIQIDGVVALGLMGQRGEQRGPFAHSSAKEKEELEVEQDIKQFGLAAGIDDPYAWAVKYGRDSAAFTCKVLKANNANQTRALLSTWGVAVSRNPHMVETLSEQERTDLMMVLCGKTQLSTQWRDGYNKQEKQHFLHVVGVLWPDLGQHSFNTDSLPPGPKREAALLLLLTDGGAPKNIEEMAQRFDPIKTSLSTQEMELISHWALANLVEDERKPAKSLVNRWKLEAIAAKQTSAGGHPTRSRSSKL